MLLLLGSPPASEELGARISLAGQRGELDADGGAPELRFELLATSSLSVSVVAIEVGVLFAASEEALRDLDPATLYNGTANNANVGVLRQEQKVTLAPYATQVVTLRAMPRPVGPLPVVFRTHLLSYRLADLTASLLFELLHTEAPADEMAVIATLALHGRADDKLRVRAQFGGDKALIAGLRARVTDAVAVAPSWAEAMDRAVAIRALGVLGGVDAEATLRELLKEPGLTRLDEALQVLLIARLRGTRLETPAAFAIPTTVRRMNDLVSVALDDLAVPKDEPGFAAQDTTTPEAVTVAEVVAKDEPPVAAWAVALACGLLLLSGLGVAGARVLHRQRQRGNNAKR